MSQRPDEVLPIKGRVQSSRARPAACADASLARAYAALIALFLTYMVSFVDRTALGVLQEPIRHELAVSDLQLGLLGGPAFAILYALTSLPIARLAERHDRAWIIAVCLLVWSAMTALCGMAQTYLQLLLARIGVSIGEAGGNPAAHSLIGDLFPVQLRARAIAIYMLGAPAGSLMGAALAGWLASLGGWRPAFMILGCAGALVVMPLVASASAVARGRFDASPGPGTSSTLTVIRLLLQNPAFPHFAAGAALVVLVGYAVVAFLPSFLLRNHLLSIREVGFLAGLINGGAAGFGTLISGFIADRLGRRDVRIYAWFPAAMVLLATPCFLLGFMLKALWPATALLMLGTVGIYSYIAPTFAQLQSMVDARMRATAASLLFLIINLIGLSIGPPLVGLIADQTAAGGFSEQGLGAYAPLCTHGAPAPGLKASCDAASAHGMKIGLAGVSLILLWASAHLYLAGRRLKPDASDRANIFIPSATGDS